jgi:hypothetical protein
MKKNIFILITALAASSLTAYGFVTWKRPKANKQQVSCSKPAEAKAIATANDFVNSLYKVEIPELVYKVESRFMTRVTKETVQNATSILDIFPEKATENLSRYKQVTVGLLTEDGEVTIMGENELLNPAQISLLRSTDYSSNFFLRSACKITTPEGNLQHYDLVYYMTIVPEKEASYTPGHEALVEYLKENTKEETVVITREGLKPGRVNFTVTKEGRVSNVYLDSTSGYPAVDKKLIELVEEMPGTWSPATNAEGEAVKQELVFFFGLMGC